MSVSVGIGAIVTAVVWAEEKKNDFDLDSVTPGVVGFIATFLVAAIVVFIAIDMNRRVRRVSYRGQIRERLEAEAAASDETPEAEEKP